MFDSVQAVLGVNGCGFRGLWGMGRRLIGPEAAYDPILSAAWDRPVICSAHFSRTWRRTGHPDWVVNPGFVEVSMRE